MDKNLEVICIDEDSDNDDFKGSQQSSSNIHVISSDEDASEGEIKKCNKSVDKNVPTNKTNINNVYLGNQSQTNKKSNFLAGTTSKNLSEPVNVEYQKSIDKKNMFPQKDSNRQLQTQGSNLKSTPTILQDILTGKPNEVYKSNLVTLSSLLNKSLNRGKIPSQKVEYTPRCNLGSSNKKYYERQNSQSSDVMLKMNAEKVFGTTSNGQSNAVPVITSQTVQSAVTSRPAPVITNQTVPVITSQPVPVITNQPVCAASQPMPVNVNTPPLQNSIAINVQSSSLQSAVQAPITINLQMPRNPITNQNNIQVPISLSQNMMSNTMPSSNNQNFIILSPLSNGMVLKPPAQQFPNQFTPNQPAFPVLMSNNNPNAFGPQTTVQNNNNNNQSQIIMMQTVSQSTTQLSNSVSRTQKLQGFAQLVLLKPSQQKEYQNPVPSSSVNKTTLLNTSSSQVQFCVKGDANMAFRPLVLNPLNSSDQAARMNTFTQFNNDTQCSNVNVETSSNVSSFTQTAGPPWKQNEAPTGSLDLQRDPIKIPVPPWLKDRQSGNPSSDLIQIKLHQSTQTNTLPCTSIPQTSQDGCILLQMLKSSVPKSQSNIVSEPNPNSVEIISIQNKTINVGLESNLRRNILPALKIDEGHPTSLPVSTQNKTINVGLESNLRRNILPTPTIDEGHPTSLQISTQNKTINVGLESNLRRNILPTLKIDEGHPSSLPVSTQFDRGISINELDSKSLQPFDPNITQISSGTEVDWKPLEVSTEENITSSNQHQKNLNISSLDGVDISIKTEEDVILIDDSSDEERKEKLPVNVKFQNKFTQDLPLTSGLLMETKTEKIESASENKLERAQDVIRIQIDATLNKSFDHSGLKINVNNASFQNFTESNSNLSSIDIKEEINGTNFTINYSSGESSDPAEKQYCTIYNDGGLFKTESEATDVKITELFMVDQEVKIENSDDKTAVNIEEFKTENDVKCTFAVEEMSLAKIEPKSESDDSYIDISKILTKSESSDSYEDISKMEPKSNDYDSHRKISTIELESEESDEDSSKIEPKSESEDTYEIGSPDMDVGTVIDSSNDSDYEMEVKNENESMEHSQTESDLNEDEEVPDSRDQTSNDMGNEISPPKEEKPFICPHCGFCVAIERNLEIHIKAFHKEKKAMSLVPSKLNEHPKNVKKGTIVCSLGNRTYKCTTCDFKSDQSSLNKHLRALHGLYACTKCSFIVNNQEEFKTHEEIHRTVKCILCDTMIAVNQYHTHLSNEHPVTFRFECKSCEFKANSEWQLRNHKCVKNEPVKSFESSNALPCNAKRKCTTIEQASHKKQKLRSDDKCTFTCNFCDFRASSELSLNQHNSTHCKMKTVFQCNYCPFTADSKFIRSKHYHVSHPDKFRHACHICTFKTTRIKRLAVHMKRHVKSVSRPEKPIKQIIMCNDCNFQTENSDFMTRHRQKRHGNVNTNRSAVQSCSRKDSSEKMTEKELTMFNSSSGKNENPLKKNYRCQYCKFIGKSQISLNEHRHNKHADKLPYSCKKCSFRASEWHMLERHKRDVHNFFRCYSLYECKLCSFKTSQKSLLTRHKYKDHWSSRHRFKCSLCSFRTPLKGEYNNHVKSAHKSSNKVNIKAGNTSKLASAIPNPRRVINSYSETKADLYFYYCTECSKRFRFISQYEAHNIIVHDSCKKCPCCLTFVSSKKQLFTHKYKEHPTKFKFKCSICSFCSSNDKHIPIHEKSHHKPIICYYCDFSVSSIGIMNDHILNFHPERNPLFCDKCGYQTMNENFLHLHRSEMHLKIKCVYCEFSTDSRQRLLSHTSDYHSAEMVACTKCSFRAEVPDLLVNHMKTCHNNVCDYCSFLATSSEKLCMHIFKMHPKEFPLLCLYCSYRASKAVNLVRHELNVHFKRTYRCKLCFFYSESITGLSNHSSKCHSLLEIKYTDSESALKPKGVKNEVGKSNENLTGPVKYQACNYSEVDSTQLYKHYVDDRSNVNQWRCLLCTYRCRRFGILQKHLRKRHSISKFYTCKYCPFGVQKKSDLFNHKKSKHPEEMSYKCDLCSYNTSNVINLQIHCRNKHKRKLSSICLRYYQDILLCSKCDFWSKNKKKLEQHIHSSCFSEDDFVNEEKERLLQKVKDLDSNKSMLDMTLNKDSQLKTILKCSLCKFSTSNRAELKFHGSSIHNTSSLYICDWCGSKTDYDLGSIIVHIEKEHKRDIKCPACSFTTLFRNTLKEHIMHNHSISLLQ